MRAGCRPLARIFLRAAAREEEASAVPRRLTRKTAGSLFSRPLGSVFLPSTQAIIPPATIIPTTLREVMPMTQPRRRDGTLGGSPPTRLVDEAGPRREARGEVSLREPVEPFSATKAPQEGSSSASAGEPTGAGCRGATPLRASGRLADGVGTEAGLLGAEAMRTCGAAGARSTGAGAEVEFAAGRWSASGPAGGGLVLRKSRGAAGGAGLGCGGTLGGVGEGVCETCQTLRCEETNSPLLGVFGPPERELSPGV